MDNNPQIPLNDTDFFANRGHVYRDSLKLLDKQLIEKALEHANGNQLLAAKILGLNRNTLRTKIKSLRIDVERFKLL